MKTTVDVRAELKIAWESRAKLCAEGAKLRAEGAKLRAEGAKLWADGSKLCAEGAKLWAEVIIRICGNITIKWVYIKTVSYNDLYRCELGNGMAFEPVEPKE